MPTEEKHGLLGFIYKLLGKIHKPTAQKKRVTLEDDIHLEPKYWQEVIDFMDTLNDLIASHTIEDSNIQQVNQRIVDYILVQINTKGQIKDIEERYSALDTLSDRILLNSLSKIVGLKHTDSTSADFTQAVEAFKLRLHQRHQEELALIAKKHP